MSSQDLQPSIVLQQKKAAKTDLIIGCIFVFTLIIISLSFDIEFVELFYDFTRAHEDLELDEIIVCLCCFGFVGIIYAIRRTLDLTQLNREIIHNAYYDYITNLPNRTLAIDRIERSITQAKHSNHQVAVLLLNINGFKHINDTYGHLVGDNLIHLVGNKLTELSLPNETVARFGGNTFLILTQIDQDSFQLSELISRVQKLQEETFNLSNHLINISYSTGIAQTPSDGDCADDLLTAADIAMYDAKKEGNGKYRFYSDKLRQEVSLRYQLSQRLQEAIRNDQLHMVYQPIIRYPSKEVTGYEALLRWKHDNTYISPEKIVSIAEEFGFINDIDHWVLKCAIRKLKDDLSSDQIMHINISPKQFQQQKFNNKVFGLLSNENIDAKNITLEITESALISDFEQASKQIKELQDFGIEIAIDDFGTGYSSLLMLKDLDINILKIDRAFISNIENNTKDRGIVNSTLVLAENLDMQVIVEGVETEEQANILQEMGAVFMQGYYFSKPVNSELINKDFSLE